MPDTGLIMAETTIEYTAHPLFACVEAVADDADPGQRIWFPSWRDDHVRGSLIGAVAAALLGALVLLPAALYAAPVPRREDIGDLVVLHVYGSYEDMGRQQAELLGPLMRDVYDFHRADYDRTLREQGWATRLMEPLLVPLASAGNDDTSGFAATVRGIAGVLHVLPREVFRASLALDAGSTVFAATGSATADGHALIGRNVDWGDAGGRRRPVVTHYHPSNGDLAHVAAAWPLMHLPTVGLNEAGFAISLNYFDTEPLFTLFAPEWPQRRALQTAHTVEEGIRIFLETKRLGAANFVAMADTSGAIALLECRPNSGCSVFRPQQAQQDWFAHSNHARTTEMIPFDNYRCPDSFARRLGMEQAVERHLGALTPQVATEILRDRTGYRFPNETAVGNLFVLNAVVVAPADRVLWHSTTMQPFAPFGEYVAFSPRDDSPRTASLPVAPELNGPAFARDRTAIAQARRAVATERDGRHAEARRMWDEIAAAIPPVLDPARVALGRAHTLFALGDLKAAYAALAPAEDEADAPFDARAYGLAMRGLVADQLQMRDEALRLWRATLAHLDSHREFNTFRSLRELAEAGLRAPQRRDELPLDWWEIGLAR